MGLPRPVRPQGAHQRAGPAAAYFHQPAVKAFRFQLLLHPAQYGGHMVRFAHIAFQVDQLFPQSQHLLLLFLNECRDRLVLIHFHSLLFSFSIPNPPGLWQCRFPFFRLKEPGGQWQRTHGRRLFGPAVGPFVCQSAKSISMAPLTVVASIWSGPLPPAISRGHFSPWTRTLPDTVLHV